MDLEEFAKAQRDESIQQSEDFYSKQGALASDNTKLYNKVHPISHTADEDSLRLSNNENFSDSGHSDVNKNDKFFPAFLINILIDQVME